MMMLDAAASTGREKWALAGWLFAGCLAQIKNCTRVAKNVRNRKRLKSRDSASGLLAELAPDWGFEMRSLWKNFILVTFLCL